MGLVLIILAIVCFILAALNVAIAAIHLGWLGMAFFALAVAVGVSWPWPRPGG